MSEFSEAYLVFDSLELVLHSSSPRLMECAAQCLSQFPLVRERAAEPNDIPSIRLSLEIVPPSLLPATSETPLWDVQNESVINERHKDRFVVRCGRDAFVEYFPARHVARARFSGEATTYHVAFSCLTPLLDWCLKSARFFLMHGSAVVRDGKGVLMVAPSGVGKSTTAMLLAGGGFLILHDDLIWVRKSGKGIELVGAPGPIRLRPDALARLEGVWTNRAAQIRQVHERDPDGKTMFFAEPIPKRDELTRCVAVCLLERSGGQTSCRAATSAEALGWLVTQSFIGDPQFAREYLGTLVGLSEDAPQFLVTLGSDVDSVPDILEEILAAADGSQPNLDLPPIPC